MEPFKNLLGIDAAKRIGKAISRAYPDFSMTMFLRGLERELEPLELKARMILLKDRLALQLRPDPSSFRYLVAALRNGENDKIGLDGFLVWPLTQFVADYGLDDFDESMNALNQMTRVFTAEFAVRPFIIRHEVRALKLFSEWARDPNEHVRRLVSEGTRPYLPWGQKLKRFAELPDLTWSLLEILKSDSSKYVQKSIANHLNDHSKLHPDWTVRKVHAIDNKWVQKQALRTLIKNGHRGALGVIGVGGVRPQFGKIRMTRGQLKIGQTWTGSLELFNPTKKLMKVIVDVEMQFLRANGKHSKKVFKGKTVEIDAKTVQCVELKIPLRKVTTRKYYDGKQFARLIINGEFTHPVSFKILNSL